MPRIPVRYLSVLTVLPLLLFSQAAEAARISFATKDCGTPPLLGLEFTIDANGEIVEAEACPQDTSFFGLPGDLVDDDDQSPLYGAQITSIDLTVISSTDLSLADFEAGEQYGADSLGFMLDFAAFDAGGGGVLSITFDDPIQLSCTFGDTRNLICAPLDLLIFIDDGRLTDPLPEGTTLRVTRVNEFTVPEPGSLALFGIGLGAAAIRRRRTTAKT